MLNINRYVKLFKDNSLRGTKQQMDEVTVKLKAAYTSDIDSHCSSRASSWAATPVNKPSQQTRRSLQGVMPTATDENQTVDKKDGKRGILSFQGFHWSVESQKIDKWSGNLGSFFR